MGLSDFLKKHKRKLLALGLAGAAGAGYIHHEKDKFKKEQNLEDKRNIERLAYYGAHVGNSLYQGRRVANKLKSDHNKIISAGIGFKRGFLGDLVATGAGRLYNKINTGHWTLQNPNETGRYLKVQRIIRGLDLAHTIGSDMKSPTEHIVANILFPINKK